jgi:hypothetical protein
VATSTTFCAASAALSLPVIQRMIEGANWDKPIAIVRGSMVFLF